MKFSFGSGSRFGRDKFQTVYVNSFGSHRCGTVIHYGGRGHLRHHKKKAVSDAHVCVSDRKISGSTAYTSLSRERRPCLTPGAPLSTGAKGPQSRGNEVTEFKSLKWPKARKVMTESLSSMKDSSSKKKSLSSMSYGSRKPIGSQQETQGDAFEFSSPLENTNNRVNRQQKRKSTAWLGVSKVISKMVEENECLRNRLMSCSQSSREGPATNQNPQREGSRIDTEEAIFGWV